MGPPQPCAYDSNNKNTDTGYPTPTSMTPSEIQEIINENMHSMIDLWVGSIPFHLYKWDKNMVSVDAIFKNDAMHINIATCLNGQDKPTKQFNFLSKNIPITQIIF